MDSDQKQKEYIVLVAIYQEVDFYPPTKNAIHLLAAKFKRVVVVEVINEGHINEGFPQNVVIHSQYRRAQSLRARLKTFTDFTKEYTRLRKKENPNLIILYDPVATMTSWFSKWAYKRKEVYWYHNHDVIEKKTVRPFSLLYFSYYLERKALNYLDIFTIPSLERIAFYNLKRFNGINTVIPNYPALYLYKGIAPPDKPVHDVVLIYQGNISEGHGFEEIMNLLPRKVNNKSVRLLLIGFSNQVYDAKLRDIIKENNLQNDVTIMDKVTYHQLPYITRKCHLGIAIYTKTDVMNSTLGTASNKIYEYTASGLPFLYYDNPYFKQYLGIMEWAIPTDLSESSLLQAIQIADDRFDQFSRMARKEFETRRNYENVFTPVLDSAITLIDSKEHRN